MTKQALSSKDIYVLLYNLLLSFSEINPTPSLLLVCLVLHTMKDSRWCIPDSQCWKQYMSGTLLTIPSIKQSFDILYHPGSDFQKCCSTALNFSDVSICTALSWKLQTVIGMGEEEMPIKIDRQMINKSENIFLHSKIWLKLSKRLVIYETGQDKHSLR